MITIHFNFFFFFFIKIPNITTIKQTKIVIYKFLKIILKKQDAKTLYQGKQIGFFLI